MTDVSAWDPVDDNNSAAPPAGWPEGMMPSGVNNSARAMMGALRREHDRIVGQIGSTAGAITAPTINTTTVNATGIITGGHVYSNNDIVATGDIGARNINTSGTVTAGALSMSSPLPIASGGTAGTTQAQAFANIATVAASIGTNPGYMKFPNGLLMQWGQTAGLAGANTIGVAFPTAFSGFVTVQATLIGDMTGIGGATGVSLSGFTATSGKTTGSAIHWFAIGF